MINPQELRISNYVEYKGQMLPVLAIDNEAFLSELKYKGLVRLPDKLPNGMVFGSSGIWCAKINPIPITPEILERCGFEYIDMPVNGYADDKHLCYQQIDGTIVFMPFCTDDKDCHIHINYLHQLQNLYFALTNQELTFKTTTHEKINNK